MSNDKSMTDFLRPHALKYLHEASGKRELGGVKRAHGAVAPGKACPSPFVPMKGLTKSIGSEELRLQAAEPCEPRESTFAKWCSGMHF